MPIYKQTTEITNIDDIWTGIERDIVEVYFGDKNVFTVWQIYEGTLPATFNANGDNMKQYQVWGNTGGVGDRTENLFEVENDMLSSLNWGENPKLNNIVYFINFKLSDIVTQELKKGIHTCSIFEHFTGGYVPNLLVCALTPTITSTVTEEYRLLTNQGETFVRTFDFSRWQNIYLIIGYGDGFRTEKQKQSKINELFDNWEISIIEGTTAPASFVPFGYEVDMRVRSLNIYNTAETSWSADGTVLNDSGAPISATGSHYTTNFIPCEPGEAYYLAGSLANETRWRVYFYDSNKNWIRRTGSKSPDSTRLIVMDENASYFQLQVGVDVSSTADWNFVHSRTAPEKYQPYSNTTTPIYIGSDPLGKDEYVDYEEGKIYRMSGGVLTPTDPPVALPALPTCDGTTIVDYAGESGAVPEKVELKYRKENF